MTNINQLMKKAQQMQSKMTALQEELAGIVVEGQSGGGLVRVSMTAKGDIKTVTLDPSLLVPDEKEMLEDLIVAALNDGRQKADAKTASEMAKITGGMSIPGLSF